MTKIGVGVGEEFPVDEPPPSQPDPEREADREARRRHWRQHHYLYIATRIAVIALIVAFIVWMFVPHAAVVSANAAGGYPYQRHFFFPFFPLLLIFLFAFAWRRRGCSYGRHHWRDGPRGGFRNGEV
jgi:hypothetical protein